MTLAKLRINEPIRVMFSGQSMLEIPAAPLDVPYLTCRALGLTGWSNIAHGGEGWDSLLNYVHDELYRGARNIDGHTDILVMNGGQGDILQFYPGTPRTGQECYDLAVEYATLARNAGFHYVITCTLPALGPILGRLTVEEQESWDDLNALLVSDPDEAFDAIVRCDTAPFDDATNLDYFVFDRTHLTQLGGRIMAERIATALATLPPFS